MSETEMKRATEEVERKTRDFDEAIERFKDSITSAQHTAGEIIQTMSEKPLALWAVVFFSGFVLGTLVGHRKKPLASDGPGTEIPTAA